MNWYIVWFVGFCLTLIYFLGYAVVVRKSKPMDLLFWVVLILALAFVSLFWFIAIPYEIFVWIYRYYKARKAKKDFEDMTYDI